MKCSFYILLLLCGAVWFASCTGPVILEEKEESGSSNEQENTPTANNAVAIIHEGTYTSPYSIAEAQALKSAESVWIEGYIVGTISGSMKSGCNYTAEGTIASNILLADTFPTGNENDHLRCLPVELPSNSTERDELNLYDNPDNYHRKVRLQGDITLYYKVVGMKKIADYIFCDEYDDDNDNDDENEGENVDDNKNENQDEDDNSPSDPDATRQDTLSIAEGIKLQSDREYNQVYIKGYIIGYTTSNKKIYYTLDNIKKSAKTNVVLADNIEETDCNKMIAVELKEDSHIQQAANLFDNPQNLHRQLTVKGAMKTYKGLFGCIDIPNGYGDDEDYYFQLEQ